MSPPPIVGRVAPDADTFADTSAPADSQREQRLRKTDEARGSGYPYRYPTDASAAGIRAAHAGLAPDQVTEHEVHIAGRLELIRRQGGLTFATLRDRTGAIQLFVDTAVVGAAVHRDFDELDRGDWVGVAGTVMTTRRGELSVRVGEFALLAKALLPPPDKHRGLTDVETRYRQRYVDLEANERTREIFRIRHTAIHAIRDHLNGLGFTEVEGPVLQTIQGGASARPFVTHHNALDIDLYLRIALELHLKRLIVGGLERVFEIGRVFRNEGIDTRHNPEFTMLEAYQAFADYHDMMDLTEGLVSAAAKAALGDTTTVHYAGQAIDLTTPWPRARFADMIAEKTGATMHPDMPIAQARAVLDRLHIPYESSWGAGRLMKEVYDEKVQHDVVGPVFCIDYPREVSPLARVHRDDPAYVERFELIVAGFELCNAYSEQNDPAEQLAAFEAEARAKQGGDPEAGDVDHDYVRALEHGMPPTGGLGIGIDRLVMLLASVDSIREVILFPTLRPEFAPPPGGGPGGAPRPLAAPTPIAPGSVAGPGVGGQNADGAAPASVVALPSMAPSTHTITPPPPRPDLHPRAVRTIAGLTALCGVLQLLSMIPFVHSRFDAREDAIGPLWVPIVGHVVSVIVGLLLILLADQLGKRKHAAWRVGVALFALGALAHLVKGPHPIALAFCVGMLVALIAYRRSFGAPVDPPSLFRLVRFVPLYLLAVLVFGVVALWTERGRITPGSASAACWRRCSAASWGSTARTPTGRRSSRSTSRRRWSRSASSGWPCSRSCCSGRWPRAPCTPRTTGSTPRASCTPTAGTRWPTSRCATTRTSSSPATARRSSPTPTSAATRWSPATRSARSSRWSNVLDEFLEMCEERAWTPALLAVREASMPLYESRGFSAFYLGDEAIIDCRRFSLDGARRKSLRSAVRRVGRTHRFQLIAESNASPRWSTSSTRSARAGGARIPSAASRCRCPRTSGARGPTRSSSCAWPCARTGRRRGSCGSCPPTGRRSATRSTSCATTRTHPTA